ncbi:hypothetical protein ACH4FX_35915 [Streptomyces sp. NPDC018019]|uniref:hypothetical protein n=1 Tax=Streptomyces sp. NPDC018019 TaxID=3365030 RepID=UPI0037AEF484
MRTITKQALIPALTVISLLTAGCSAAGGSGTGAAASTDPGTGATAAPAAEGNDAAGTSVGKGGGGQRLTVGAAPASSGSAGAAAVARPSGDGRPQYKSALRVASYDRRSGRAVVAGPVKHRPAPSASASTSASPSASASPAPKNSAVEVGDVIASAPAPGAPSGVLAKVTAVRGTTRAGTEVNTAPTTLDALLGKGKANGKVAVAPSAVSVEPLVKGVQVSWAQKGERRFGPHGATLPLGSLRLDVGASVATAEDAPASAAASVAGFVELSPKVEFAYDGSRPGNTPAPTAAARTAPGGAFIGLSGDWSSQWRFKGRAAASAGNGKPLRTPFAKLHADPVIQVGPVPVVVNLDLTCYLAVEADGRVSVDIKQDVKGDFRVGGGYTWAEGWRPVSESGLHATPVQAAVTAEGRAKATLGAEASVGLYGAVGVSADVAPYLRGEASAVATGSFGGNGGTGGKGRNGADSAKSGNGTKATATADWKAFGGLDLTGALQTQLTVFGTPLFQKRIPLGTLHREWQLASGHFSTAPKPRTG